MKRIMILALMVLLLGGCKKNKNVNYIDELTKYNSSLDKYELKASLKILRDDGDVNFTINVAYLKPNYYKVILQNTSNNHTQVIVKNDDGVYVLTPDLNKQYKFDSEWPLNSSNAYLYQSLVKEILNDETRELTVNDDTFMVTSKVNYKANASLKKQQVTFSKKGYKPISCTIFDSMDKAKIKVTYEEFKTDAKLSKDDFKVELINTTVRLEIGEGGANPNLKECLPTAVLEGYTLSNSVFEENYSLHTYKKGDSLYLISASIVTESCVLTQTREFKDIVLLDNTLGFVGTNSLSFYNDSLLVTIYQNNFNLEELMTIANSYK